MSNPPIPALNIFILEQGSGDNAKSGNVVSAQYYGVLESDGTMFDNSLGRGMPFTFTFRCWSGYQRMG